ncbi:hypothetical protein BKA70DRAFT_693098 [Coprinopsis sp. MPI-PUGE-AT-0042]|nr:hypothetical protein BKA70DRAFT_693098 [Coprinopsis sp. MPI-PUGE-AT-0042]
MPIRLMPRSRPPICYPCSWAPSSNRCDPHGGCTMEIIHTGWTTPSSTSGSTCLRLGPDHAPLLPSSFSRQPRLQPKLGNVHHTHRAEMVRQSEQQLNTTTGQPKCDGTTPIKVQCRCHSSSPLSLLFRCGFACVINRECWCSSSSKALRVRVHGHLPPAWNAILLALELPATLVPSCELLPRSSGKQAQMWGEGSFRDRH